MKETVECLECGREFKCITPSHLKKHGMAVAEYLVKYPGANLTSEATCKKRSECTAGENHPFYGLFGEDHPAYGNIHSSATKNMISDANKGKIINDKTRNAVAEANRNRVVSDATRKKMSDSQKARPPPSDKTRAKLSKVHKGKIVSAATRALISAAGKARQPVTDKTRAKLSKALKGKNHPLYGKSPSAETRAKTSKTLMGKYTGENSCAWKGGGSFEPYCDKFTEELRRQVRNRYDNCDFFSGLPDYICNIMDNGKVQKLSVHHVDYNKVQGCEGIEWRLVPLSRKNHAKTHGNRIFWEKLICYALEHDETYYDEEIIDIYSIN